MLINPEKPLSDPHPSFYQIKNKLNLFKIKKMNNKGFYKVYDHNNMLHNKNN
jgi:hypothetical protein